MSVKTMQKKADKRERNRRMKAHDKLMKVHKKRKMIKEWYEEISKKSTKNNENN